MDTFKLIGLKLHVRRTSRAAAGFTILELLVVIAIMAVLATLATGAAIKSVKQSRVRKVESTCRALEMALVNYRAQEGKWPFSPKSDLDEDPYDKNIRWAHGEDNKEVFKKVYHGPGSANNTAYLDASALLTLVEGRRVQLRAALGARKTDVPLVYPDPSNTTKIRYYCVRYNTQTDSVTIERQDESHVTYVNNEPKYWECPEKDD